MLITTQKLQHHPLLPQSMAVDTATISFSSSVHDLGVILDNTLVF